MKRIFTLASLALVAAVLLAGCAEKNSIVGRWVNDNENDYVKEVTFFTDGTVISKGENHTVKATYLLEGNLLKVFEEGEAEPDITEYIVKNGKLTIIDKDDDERIVLTKTK